MVPDAGKIKWRYERKVAGRLAGIFVKGGREPTPNAGGTACSWLHNGINWAN